MTTEELETYNKLTSEQMSVYDFTKGQHPNWNHQQIMAKMSIGCVIDDKIGNGGGTVEIKPDDPAFMQEVLTGAKRILSDLGCVAGDIINLIDNALGMLANIIDAGINYVGDKLKQFWNWLNG